MRKWLSLRHWRRTFARVFILLRSNKVSLPDKLLFLIPVLLYWILPDVLVPIPFFPLDDIGITLLLAQWFARRMETKYNIK